MTNKKPWDEIDASPERVDQIWEQFNMVKERAEQFDFPRILMCDLQFTPLYQSLRSEYDQYHAQMFIYGLSKILDELGYC